MDAEQNIRVCQERVHTLLDQLKTAYKAADYQFMRQAISRLIHYRDRLAIVEPTSKLEDMYKTLTLLVQCSLEDIEDVLNNPRKKVSGQVLSASEDYGAAAVDLSASRAESSRTGTIPKASRDRIAASSNQLVDIGKEQPARSASQSEANSFSSGRESTYLGNSPWVSGVAAVEEPVSRRHLQRQLLSDRERNVHESQQAASYLRGAEERNFGSQPQQFSRHRAARSSEKLGFQEDDSAPPPYASREAGESFARNEYSRLRDELLERYMRREQEANQQRRWEDRRSSSKAIHNWQIFYKGERDGASLNEFIQSVEVFALSEEVPEQVLLQNIKHLLKGDALKWYARAFLRGDLRSWGDFKRLIRGEFLPSSYAYILRAEAYHRLQGEQETFSDFFADISTLFSYANPPATDREKLFIIKKNMNSTYAPVAAAQQAASVEQLVEACKEFDELRKLQQLQRRMLLPAASLLEPSLATPVPVQRANRSAPMNQRYGRVNVLEEMNSRRNEEAVSSYGESSVINSSNKVEDRLEELIHQVDALRVRFERREQNTTNTRENQSRPAVSGQEQPEPTSELPKLPSSFGKRPGGELVTEGPNSSPCFDDPSQIPDFNNINSLVINLNNDNRPHAVIEVLGKSITGLLDSGANCSLLGGSCVQLVEQLKLRKGSLAGGIKTADGTEHHFQTFVRLPIAYNGKTRVIPVLLLPTLPDCVILGMNFWNEFGVKAICCSMKLQGEVQGNDEEEVNSNFDSNVTSKRHQQKQLLPEQSVILEATVANFPTATEGRLGRTNLYTHRIEIGEAQPKKQRYYVMSKYVLDEVNKEIDRMIKLDVIEEARFSPWNNPLVAVKKKTGQYRVCLDARHLNSIMINEGYPIPQIAAIMNNLSGCKFISSIDLKDAFWQIPLETASRQLTAFTVPQRGHFQFKVVPFGLCTASQGLERVMVTIFADMEPKVFHYLDDIIVCSETFEEHIKLLEEVAKRLRAANLTISAEKSCFCRKEIKYLGYVLNEDGWMVDPEKTSCVVNFPIPTTRKEVQRFIGMCNWYRRFVADFSEIATPLTELTKTKHKFRWTVEAEEAFLRLKSALVSTPILAPPDYTKQFAIACDASDVAIGAVLTQETDGQEHPICYFSQKLSTAERKYSVTQRECLAVIRAIEKFRGYVEGVHFIVYCDHSALSYLKTMKNPTALMCRWLLRLNAFDFEIRYRKGSVNVVPDTLSRIVAPVTFTQGSNADDWYARMKQNVKETPNKFADFQIIQDELYKNCTSKDDAGNTTHRWKKAIPKENRVEIMQKFHDAPSAAHLGFQKTLQKIQVHFYWPKMREEVSRYVKQCKVCKGSKAANSKMMPQMGKLKPARTPWELISIDFVGPLTRSRSGNTVMLVVVDWVTKYIVVHPMKSADSCKMVEFLENQVFLKFSRPRIILSDNGKQFISSAFKSLLSKHNIQHMLTAYYCPMVNNAERVNRVLVTCIRSLIDEDHRTWDEHLPAICAAINSAKHEVTGTSPHVANFGRELILHTDLYTQEGLNTDEDPKIALDIRLSTIRRIQEFVMKRIRNNHAKSKERYDLRKRTVIFNVGDLVWRRTFTQSSKVDHINRKLDPKFLPAIVKAVLGTNLYTLEDVSTGKRGQYHAKDIKAD
ncbi:uncharacterized protein LOC129752573 [Uranotaenia lowii]|uniref:uncharacterized protein LOC129752573 n=1 Tax=Uranotaenia lowii TaxID=190385 RepID=UPI0024795D15|nr:uncharacterized protein LOC129752573 [Uranotaenia lowii]